MQAALKEFVVHGVVTNIDFMQSVLAHDDFANGKVTTRWVETTLESNSLLFETREQAPALQSLIPAALADFVFDNRKSTIANSNEPDPYSPWKNPSGFRI
jgi:pyruvate carboxylase